jgi:hypothetical protein
MSVFSEILAGDAWEGLAYLRDREVPETAHTYESVLTSDAPVLDEDGPVEGDRLLRDWPARETAQDIQENMHARDLERVVVAAASGPFPVQPPADTALGAPPVPRNFTFTLPARRAFYPFILPGGRELARFSPGPPPRTPAPLRGRNVVSLTPLARRMRRLRKALGNIW